MISLEDLNIVDNDENLQEFQKLWKADSKFLVVDITPITVYLNIILAANCED